MFVQPIFFRAVRLSAAARLFLTAIAAGLLVVSAQAASAAATEGAAAPDCVLSPIDGGATSGLSQYKGKVLLVDFWASWCGPCGQSFPFFNEMHAQLKDQGLQIVGVNVDEEVDEAKVFLADHPASFTVMRDASAQCANDFAVKAMPSTYVIDRNGLVHHVHLGYRPSESQELRALVEKLLGAK